MAHSQSPAVAVAERLCRPQRVGVFGHRGVGKTTLLTLLYREAVGGRLPDLRLAAADARTADYLSDKILPLENGQPIPGTLAETDLRFHLYHKGTRLDLLFKDYQGEHVELGRDRTHPRLPARLRRRLALPRRRRAGRSRRPPAARAGGRADRGGLPRGRGGSRPAPADGAGRDQGRPDASRGRGHRRLFGPQARHDAPRPSGARRRGAAASRSAASAPAGRPPWSRTASTPRWPGSPWRCKPRTRRGWSGSGRPGSSSTCCRPASAPSAAATPTPPRRPSIASACAR